MHHSSVDVSSVPNNADDNLARSFICEVKDSIIADANAPAIAILEFLAADRKRIGFQRQERSRDALLDRCRKSVKLLFASRASSTPQLTRECGEPSGHHGAVHAASAVALPARAYR